jgi:hypothetical protein
LFLEGISPRGALCNEMGYPFTRFIAENNIAMTDPVCRAV